LRFRPRRERTAKTSEHDIHIVARIQSVSVNFFAREQQSSARRAKVRKRTKKTFCVALLRDFLHAVSLLGA